MIVDCPTKLIHDECFIALSCIAPHIVINVKLEGLSATGSIKIKAAVHMVEALEAEGRLRKGSAVIESSSGNLGLALSMVCAAKGYAFTCVSDPNISPITARLITAYGAKLIIVEKPDDNGGYLGTRISLIKKMLANDGALVWINQYENQNNVRAHRRSTGQSILKQFPDLDFAFVGAGTTGTLGGVSQEIREIRPQAKIIAVDTLGSVTFGGAPGKRLIPGLGTSSPPPIRSYSSFDDLLMVAESDTISMCRSLAVRGVMLGGSSGTVLAAVKRYAAIIPSGACVVAISPDMGDRYVDTIYSDAWVRQHFPHIASLVNDAPAHSSQVYESA